MRRVLLVVGVVGLLGSAPTSAQEAVATTRVVSVGLFKNGLVIVRRAVEVPKAGTYRLDVAPEPVHGTFWVEADCPVEASVKMRATDVSLPGASLADLQEVLAGKKVVLRLRDDKIGPVSGTLLKLAPPEEEVAVAEENPRAAVALRARPHLYATGPDMLVVKTAKGLMYIERGQVTAVETEATEHKITRRRPFLMLDVAAGAKRPTVTVSYLTHGLAWAPSYRLDVSDPKTLAIEMAAAIRNEMGDVDGAEFRLISGFPSVEFARVTSPLAPTADWQQFFQQLSQRGDDQEPVQVQQVIMTNNFAPRAPRFKLGATPAGEGVDLHYESIGKRSLRKGEALSVTVGRAKADYERVVEWTVGTSAAARKYAGRAEGTQDELWDVLHFKNPFAFPMTTAPALVVEGGRFNGQRTAFWANAGEETRVRVTRALSVRAASLEEEDPTLENVQTVVDGQTYTRIPLRGELRLSNHRKEPVKVHVRHQIRGSIREIEGNPRLVAREDSLTEVNRVHEALWTVTLGPGQEQKLSYRFSVLVRR